MGIQETDEQKSLTSDGAKCRNRSNTEKGGEGWRQGGKRLDAELREASPRRWYSNNEPNQEKGWGWGLAPYATGV